MTVVSSVFCLVLTSCYSSTVCVGDIKKSDDVEHVATVHNAHFLYGLVAKKEVKASKYVGDAKDYKVKRHVSFLDGFLSWITIGIYTPTTTKFYLPED